MAPRILRAVVGVLVLAGVAGLLASAAAGGVDATVTGKATDGEGPYVVATTDVGGFEFQRHLPTPAWTVVQEGDDVVYQLHNGETAIYTWERGDLIWRG